MISGTKCRRKRVSTKMGDDVGGTRYTTAVTQALCSVAAGIALNTVMKNKVSTEFPKWSIGCSFGCCVFGALVYGVNRMEDYIPIHRRAHFLVHCVAVPLLTTHFALANNYDREVSYLLLALPIFPVVANLADDSNQYTLQDTVVGAILAFKAYMHFQSNNVHGLAFCISYAMFHFIIGPDTKFGDLSALELQTIGFIFNQYFIIKALYT